MTNKLPKKIEATWESAAVLDDWFVCPPLQEAKGPMTKEEEADEIIRRLATPPKSSHEVDMDALMSAMAEEIKREIDNEMLKKLREMHAKDRS